LLKDCQEEMALKLAGAVRNQKAMQWGERNTRIRLNYKT
jgi:hypothetical protein